MYTMTSRNLEPIFVELRHKVNFLVNNELNRFENLLSPGSPACSEEEEKDEEDQSGIRERLLKITLQVLRDINQTDLANTLQIKLAPACHQNIKSTLWDKVKNINEGISDNGSSALLNEIYTELSVTVGGSGEINNEHEIRQIETSTRDTPIKCNNIFSPLIGQEETIRTVLTKGVAGIGKTVSVEKFILDWAEGRANRDVLFIFPLPFRELNFIMKEKFSLVGLLHRFFTETRDLKPRDYYRYKVLFIFDGLDECRLPLDFHNNERLSDVTQSASVDILLTNLIKGNLLPTALLWITSRPAACGQIPLEYVDQVTEVRGFNDFQKEEYFRKRISNQVLANRIIAHIRSSRSLYVMCQIPVFCWIFTMVLEKVFDEVESREIPKTLTQIFIHFLIFQTKHKSQMYFGKCYIDTQDTHESILALGKLAFHQMQKGNLIFYEEDVIKCGAAIREGSVYSGLCMQIFREGFGLEKVYSFLHLSVQEFLAALFAYLSLVSDNINELQEQDTDFFGFFIKSNMTDFLKKAVDKALQSENGHLDLFLRFLLGISLESNQTLLRGLLPLTESNSGSKEEIIQYIKEKIRENPSLEKTFNLFYCLNELNDNSLVEEVQMYLSKGNGHCLSQARLSPDQWSALVFVLLSSEEELNVFDLAKYDTSEECFLRLLPVIKASRKALLCLCNLSEKSCAALASVLSSNPSNLRELDLSYNKLQDSGVRLLSNGLEDPQCKLKMLRLCECNLTEKSCISLVSVLMSSTSCLTELDLSNNKLQDSGIKLISVGLESPHCKVEILRLCGCNLSEKSCAVLASVLSSNSLSLKELDLSENMLQDSGMKLLSAGLKNPHCTLEILKLLRCSISEEGYASLALALKSNPSPCLRELDLRHNEPGVSGVKMLSDLLKDPHCKLEKLQILDPTHFRELDLKWKNLGDSGVKPLSDLLKDQRCKLEKLQLRWCYLTENICPVLASALSSTTTCLRELDLGNNKLCDAGVELLSGGLKNSNCKLKILSLRGCGLSKKSCTVIASVLSSNSSSLRELDLSDNNLGDSGVKELSDGLKNLHCKLEILRLYKCCIREEGFVALASVLSSSTSHLRQLNLNSNKPGESGMKLLTDLLENPYCKLTMLHI
ncbi:NACHT, LRR and PYD domains-containing protein 3-like [Salminus brasiliensis]|uniref:NACHT, LRR and PYD domains-containing protein 3-like n=1 Tax=Salminus brasiliensis TaxID=930266 RepID=UPI003B8301AA